MPWTPASRSKPARRDRPVNGASVTPRQSDVGASGRPCTGCARKPGPSSAIATTPRFELGSDHTAQNASTHRQVEQSGRYRLGDLRIVRINPCGFVFESAEDCAEFAKGFVEVSAADPGDEAFGEVFIPAADRGVVPPWRGSHSPRRRRRLRLSRCCVRRRWRRRRGLRRC